MWEESVNAGLRLRRVEDKLRLPVFQQNSVIVVYDHRPVCIPANCRADAKNRIIQPVRESGGPDHHKNYADENSSKPDSQVRGRGLIHEARL